MHVSHRGTLSIFYAFIAIAVFLTTALDAQLLANTPGGVRDVDAQQQSSFPCSGEGPAACEQTAPLSGATPLELDILSGGEMLYESSEVLYESSVLDFISEAQRQVLIAGLLSVGRTEDNSVNTSSSTVAAGGSAIPADMQVAQQPGGQTTAGANYAVQQQNASDSSSAASAADEAVPNSPAGTSKPSGTSSYAIPSNSTPSSEQSMSPFSAPQTTTSTTGSTTLTSIAPSDVLANAGSSEDPTLDLPATGYQEVVIASLKLAPIPLEQLKRVAGVDAAAEEWQRALEESLSLVTANATNISAIQVQTKATSVINLGLELTEPPMQLAAAGANAIANSIKVWTADDAVLVGVSLLRLGSSSQQQQQQQLPSSSGWLNSVSNSSNKDSSRYKGIASNSNSNTEKSNDSGIRRSGSDFSTSSGGSALALLTIYGVGEPSNAIHVADKLMALCPTLFSYGSAVNSSICGRVLLNSYVAAVNEAAQNLLEASELNTSMPARSLLDSQAATSTSSNNTGRSGRSADLFSVVNKGGGQGGAAGTGSFTANSLKVRQLPEVSIIINQAVGITADQKAANIAGSLDAWLASPRGVLPQLLSVSGLAILQTGASQIVELAAAKNKPAAGHDTVAVMVPSTVKQQGNSSGASNAMVIGVAVAAALAVTAVSAAAAVIVVVKQRVRAAKARADTDQLPKKRRKGGKGKGISSKYLPTSMLNPGSPSPTADAASGSAPGGLISIQLPVPLSPNLAVLSPGGSGTLLAHQSPMGPAAAAAAGAGLNVGVLSPTAGAGVPGHAASGPPPALTQPLARGDSVSSAVRFDMVEGSGDSSSTANSSASGSVSEAESEGTDEDTAVEQAATEAAVVRRGDHTPLHMVIVRPASAEATLAGRNSSRAAAGSSGSSSSSSSSRSSAHIFSRPASAAELSRTLSNDMTAAAANGGSYDSTISGPSSHHQQQQQQQVAVSQPKAQLRHRSHSPSEECMHGSSAVNVNLSSSRARVSGGGMSSSDAATPRWWAYGGTPFVAARTSQGGTAAGDDGPHKTIGVPGMASQQTTERKQPQQQSKVAAAAAPGDGGRAAASCSEDKVPTPSGGSAACLRLFSRSLSASTLQVIEAAVAAVTEGSSSSQVSSNESFIVSDGSSYGPGTPMLHNQQQQAATGRASAVERLSPWGSYSEQLQGALGVYEGSAGGSAKQLRLQHEGEMALPVVDSVVAAIALTSAADAVEGAAAKEGQQQQQQQQLLLGQSSSPPARRVSRPLVSPFQTASNCPTMFDAV